MHSTSSSSSSTAPAGTSTARSARHMAGQDAGILTVFCECASALGDSYYGDIFGNQDPYLILRIDKVTRKTNFARQGGKCPVWNETLSFQLGPTENEMQIALMDKNMLIDSKLGEAQVSLSRVRESRAERLNVPVGNKKGDCMGVVSLAMTFHNGAGPPPPMPMGPAVGAPTTHAHAAAAMPMGAYGAGMPHPGPTTAIGMPAGPPGAYPNGPPPGYPPPSSYPNGYPPQGPPPGGYPPQYAPPPPGTHPPPPPGYPPQGF